MPTPIENFNLVEGVNLDDSQFTESEILAAQSVVRQYLGDKYYDLDLSELSSLNDLVVRPLAQVFLLVGKLVSEFAKTNTLSSALASASSSDKIVDALLSNFSVSRRNGNPSSGRVKITFLGSQSSVSIPKSTVFSTIDGLTYSPATDIVAAETPTTEGQIQLHADVTGTQTFAVVPVVASAPGLKYNVEQYTPLSVSPVPFQMISAVAFSKFSGGDDSETNQQVIARLLPAMSARNLASPMAIEQTLRDAFPSIQQISVHGINSPLMSRNSHNVFSIKAGCMCDVYVKTSSFFEDYSVSKIADPIVAGSAAAELFPRHIGKYAVKLSRYDIPGSYGITYITPQEDSVVGGYPIVERLRSFNKKAADGTTENDITLVSEGAYSSFGEEYAVFDTGSVADTEIGVTVHADALPDIRQIQEFVNSAGAQTAMVDTLVRAVIPCVVETSEIKVRAAVGSVTAEDLQSAVIGYINSADPKTGSVRIDGIVQVLRSNPAVISVDTPIRITGTVMCPDASYSSVSFSTESSLEIPADLSMGYGPQNIGFFARSSTIPLTVIEV